MIALKHRRLGFAACSLIAIGLLGAWFSGYRVNLTDSFPRGLWRLTDAPIAKGELVLFCPPDTVLFEQARDADYLGYGTCEGGFAPLIKRVVATPGDRVAISAGGVLINETLQVNSKRIAADSAGRDVPQAPLPRTVPTGHVLLMSDYNVRSYDSRYFGAVPTARIQGVVVPILTENDGGLS